MQRQTLMQALAAVSPDQLISMFHCAKWDLKIELRGLPTLIKSAVALAAHPSLALHCCCSPAANPTLSEQSPIHLCVAARDDTLERRRSAVSSKHWHGLVSPGADDNGYPLLLPATVVCPLLPRCTTLQHINITMPDRQCLVFPCSSCAWMLSGAEFRGETLSC